MIVPELNRPEKLLWIILTFCLLQAKYKESGKKSRSQSVYSQLPETTETQFAKTVSELQSEVTTKHANPHFYIWTKRNLLQGNNNEQNVTVRFIFDIITTLFLVVFVAGDTFTADPEPAATRIQTYIRLNILYTSDSLFLWLYIHSVFSILLYQIHWTSSPKLQTTH